jgi:hypothetical protein
MNHDGRRHVYHKRRNPSGCTKFYCYRRYRPIYYWLRWRPRGGWRTW